jgi:plasmid stability protein
MKMLPLKASIAARHHTAVEAEKEALLAKLLSPSGCPTTT